MKKYHKLNVKISLIFLVLVVIVAVGVGRLLYNINFTNSINFSRTMLERCAVYVDSLVDADNVKDWLENGKDDMYDYIQSDLEYIRSVFHLPYIFVYKPMTDSNGTAKDEAVMVFDINPTDALPEQRYEFGQHLTDILEFEELKKVLATGEPQTTTRLSSRNHTELITTIYPMRLDSGEIYSVIGICGTMKNVKDMTISSSVAIIVLFEIVIVLFAVVMLLYINRRIIRPVKILSGRMDSFVSGSRSGDLKFTFVTEIHTHDEIEQMTDNFNCMADSMIKYTNDLKVMTAARERLSSELDLVKSIRSATSSAPGFPAFPERSDFELFASQKNTVTNGCSFCNYFMTDEDHLFIVIGETVGNNLPSTLMSMFAATNIYALAKMGVEPYKIAFETNNSLSGFDHSNMSMTVNALIVKVDLNKGEMKYVNAGMPPIIVKKTGEPYYAADKEIQFNLGEMKGVSFKQNTVSLNQGYTFFFTSYGVPYMKNGSGEMFSEKRLVEEINEISSLDYPLDRMIGELEDRLDSFRGNTAIELDTTILGFRYFG